MISLLFLVPVSLSYGALKLDNYLEEVQQNHKGLQALVRRLEASESRRVGGDLALVPVLTAKTGYLMDYKHSVLQPGMVQTRSEARDYSLGVSKSFSTGTRASVAGVVADRSMDVAGVYSGSLPATSYLAFGLSQSLWKDFFGRQTELRRDREFLTAQLEKQSLELQRQQILIEAENAYWDLIYLTEEATASLESLTRAQRIEKWVYQRFSTGIGDQADRAGAQALAATRQLQWMNSRDALDNARSKVATFLGLADPKNLPPIAGDLSKMRSPKMFVAGQGSSTVRMDSFLLYLEAQVKRASSLEVDEGYKPDLSLDLGYQTNGLDDSTSGALGRIADRNTPTYTAGLKFSWLFDTDVKTSARRAAKLEAEGAVLAAQRSLLEGSTAYSELLRRHSWLAGKIKLAEVVHNLQKEKAKAESNKLARGRTITSQVITAEQDAAEAELNLIKVKADQRKLETQGRLYIQIDPSATSQEVL